MTRKDSEKESDRPHYYSQFWLDVAAGRKIIGASRPEDETAETEPQEVAPHKSVRSAAATIEHEEPAYNEVETPAAEEEVYEPEPFVEPEAEEDFLGGEEEFDQELPNIIVDEEAEVPKVPVVPVVPGVPDVEPLDEEEDEDFFDEEEEEDEDMEWGRGRKKPKPGRQVKQPPKRPKRDRDRRF